MRSFLAYWLLLGTTWTWAQTAGDQVMAYTVEDAIAALESEYSVRFSYSKQIVPYQEVVELDMSESSLPKLLDALKEQTGIVYKHRGKRVALSYDPTLRTDEGTVAAVEKAQDADQSASAISALPSSSLPPELAAVDLDLGGGELIVEEGVYFEQSKSLIGSRPTYDPVAQLQELKEKDPRVSSLRKEAKESLQSELSEPSVATAEEEIYPAQISLLPAGELTKQKLDRKYHLSINGLAGKVGSVEGFEFGMLHNHITNDLEGVQISGFANRVDGDANGGQIAGFSNRGDGTVRGAQFAGVANRAYQADAIQLAGFYNHNEEVSRGFQVAGIFNISKNIGGTQVAGLFNSSSGNNDLQISGLINMAGQTRAQLSGFVNVAREVKWFQLGIINVADTVGGASIGLLNLIRRGYNKIEFSISEAMYVNLAVKLGTKGFYNIFQVSSNFKRNLAGNGLIWGYGYGFGFFQKLAPGLKLNPEILVMNIHERNLLQPDLNLLNQGKILFHFSRSRKMEFFAGPTFNLSISKVKSFDSSIVGTNIAPYEIWNTTYFRSFNSINTKFWIGFSAGVRI